MDEKSCETCLFWPEFNGKRYCTWFSATQLGRKVKKIGPFWANEVDRQTKAGDGKSCPAYEPS